MTTCTAGGFLRLIKNADFENLRQMAWEAPKTGVYLRQISKFRSKTIVFRIPAIK
jgi:hypothetical protein